MDEFPPFPRSAPPAVSRLLRARIRLGYVLKAVARFLTPRDPMIVWRARELLLEREYRTSCRCGVVLSYELKDRLTAAGIEIAYPDRHRRIDEAVMNDVMGFAPDESL